MKRITSIFWVSAFLILTSCAGRTPNPVSSYQYGDKKRSLIVKFICIGINDLQSYTTDSKSVELQFMSVRGELGVPKEGLLTN